MIETFGPQCSTKTMFAKTFDPIHMAQQVILGQCTNVNIVAGVFTNIATGTMKTTATATGQCSKATVLSQIIQHNPNLWEALNKTIALQAYCQYSNNPQLIKQAQIKLFMMES